MGALLNNAALIHHQNAVGDRRCRHLVGDKQDRLALGACLQVLQNLGGGLVIDTGEGVIQDENGGIDQ